METPLEERENYIRYLEEMLYSLTTYLLENEA